MCTHHLPRELETGARIDNGGRPLYVAIAEQSFGKYETAHDIAQHLAVLLITANDPPADLVCAAFEAAHARGLDMHNAWHEFQATGALGFRRGR